MKVYIEKEDKTLKLDYKGSVKELLKQIKVNPETVIVVKEDEIITEDEILEKNDEIKLLSVVSGG